MIKHILFLLFALVVFSQNSLAQANNPDVPQSDTISEKPKSLRTLVEKEDLTYGLHSVNKFTTEDFFNNHYQYTFYTDTFTNFHRYTQWQTTHGEVQNLGVNGSAYRSIFPTSPSHIGKRLGMENFDEFLIEEPQHFNTYSPFSYIKYVQGGSGQQVVDALFTANASENVNFGVKFNHHTSYLLLGKEFVSKQNRMARHRSFNFFVSKTGKDKRYEFIGDYTIYGNDGIESGGLIDSVANLQELYQQQEGSLSNYLSGTTTDKRGSRVNFMHQINVLKSKGIQVLIS